MKKKQYIFLVLIATLINSIQVKAQSVNWRKIDNKTMVVGVYGGLEYGLIYGAYLGRGIQIKNIVLLPSVDISFPLGNKAIDDYEFKIGSSAKIVDKKKLVVDLSIVLANRQNKNPFSQIQNMGLLTGLGFGYYKEKWHVALCLNNDYAFATHIKHSKDYLGNYPEAKNGWYKNAAMNTSVGMRVGLSVKKIDIILGAGLIRANGLKNSPSLPFYGKIGVNYRF